MRKIVPLAMLLIAATLRLSAQVDNNTSTSKTSGEPEIFTVKAIELCQNYGIDVRIVRDASNLNDIVDSLKEVQPVFFPLILDWCSVQKRRITTFRNSLQNDYRWDGDKVWMDSTHCVTGALRFMELSAEALDGLDQIYAFYEKKEQARLEAERKAAETQALLESIRLQKEKEERLNQYKDTIALLHQQISATCDGKSVSDKERLKQLKDYYYSYLAIYNRYDLKSTTADDQRFEQLTELKNFQKEMIDSVLGPQSYATRISDFSTTFKNRCGKTHSEVNKSYSKVSKKMQVPIIFKTIAEYRDYVGSMKDILTVQSYYLQAINYRDTLATNNTRLQNQSKKHKEVYSAYQQVQNDFNLVPDFTTLREAEQYIGQLQELVLVQKEYCKVVNRLETIERLGDSLVSNCPKRVSDMGASYKKLAADYDFTPRFRNIGGAQTYNRQLDDFEQMQVVYGEAIAVRNTMTMKADTITTSKIAPKGLSTGYKQMISYYTFTPEFNTLAGGESYLKQMQDFVRLQDKFILIISNNEKIDATTRRYKTAFKDFSNIGKAYERLLKSYDYDLNILSEADINSYLEHQMGILSMQNRFEELLKGTEKSDYNTRLKKVKDVSNIKLILQID